MTRWEYLQTHRKMTDDEHNALGADGWELVAIRPILTFDGVAVTHHVFHWKRPLVEPGPEPIWKLWVPTAGATVPPANGVLIDVWLRSGTVLMGVTPEVLDWIHRTDNFSTNDIVAWKYHRP